MERNPKFITLLHFLLGDEFDSYMASQGTPIKISPLDILGFSREHPDLFYEHLLNRKKHKPMKKYRVVTDNLNWVGIPKDSIIEEIVPSMYAFYTGLESKSLIGSKEMGYALFLRPEWFQEIKE